VHLIVPEAAVDDDDENISSGPPSHDVHRATFKVCSVPCICSANVFKIQYDYANFDKIECSCKYANSPPSIKIFLQAPISKMHPKSKKITHQASTRNRPSQTRTICIARIDR
jgi:hypothetical protein